MLLLRLPLRQPRSQPVGASQLQLVQSRPLSGAVLKRARASSDPDAGCRGSLPIASVEALHSFVQDHVF